MTTETDKIESGDKVKLKTGGPDMTAGEKDNEGMIACYWFDANHVYHKEVFHMATLKKTR